MPAAKSKTPKTTEPADTSSFDVPTVDDDVYVNEGSSYDNGIYYPGEPEERKEAEEEQAAEKAGPIPVLQNVHQWLLDQAKECDNIHAIEVTELTINGVKYSRKVSVEAQVLCMQLMKERMNTKAEEFKDFAEEQDA